MEAGEIATRTPMGGRCPGCGRIAFPAPRICTGCRGERVEPLELSGRGRLYSYTVIHAPPPGWTAPYAVGYVDLEEGPRVFAHLRDGAPELDMLVEVVVAARGDVEVLEAGPDA
jgi:uncharacterized protein